MPTANVRWLGELPQRSIAKILLEILEKVTWAEIEEYTAVATYEPNGPDSEKVLICQEQAFLCVWQQGVIVIIPDSALNFTKLVDIHTHEIVNVPVLTLRNVLKTMSL